MEFLGSVVLVHVRHDQSDQFGCVDRLLGNDIWSRFGLNLNCIIGMIVNYRPIYCT